MADIDIERKRAGSYWPWIAALLAVLFVVWIWAAMDGPDAPEQATMGAPAGESPVGTSGTTPAPVSEYLRFAGVEGTGSAGDMGRPHEYTAEGLRKLDAALEAVVSQRPSAEASSSLDGFQQTARRIQQDPTSARHAGQVRDAFTRAAEVIASIDGSAAEDVRSAAEAIGADQPLLEQQDEVEAFFRQSAQAIQRLSGEAR